MPGMMMKEKKPMSYKDGGAVKKMPTKKTDTYKDANSAVKGAKKRGEPAVTFMMKSKK